MAKENKIFYFTVLNVLSCLAVVYLHTNGVFWSFPKGRLWISSNFIETFFYFAVPVFFMLSGATLLDYRKKYSTSEFFEKRIEKTVFPFIVWSIIAVCVHVVEEPQDMNCSVIWLINAILSIKYMYIYWFFIPLFSLYIFMPILSVIDRKIFKYAIGVGIMFVSFVPLVFKLLGIKDPFSIQESHISIGYILYLIIGYYIANNDVTKYKKYIYFLGVIGWLMHFYGTIILSVTQIDVTFKHYLGLPALLHSIAIFVFIKHIDWDKIIIKYPCIDIGFSFFAKYTFGIYLVHIYFVRYLPKAFVFSNASIIWRTIGALGVFLCSALLVCVLKKIPIVKRIVP